MLLLNLIDKKGEIECIYFVYINVKISRGRFIIICINILFKICFIYIKKLSYIEVFCKD